VEKIKIALAPMAGITDSAFRIMNKLGGTDVTYSEMAHIQAITYGNKKTFEMLKTNPFESPYIVQLFGKDPKYFAKAAKIISKGVPSINYSFNPKQKKFINYLEKELEDNLPRKVIEIKKNYPKEVKVKYKKGNYELAEKLESFFFFQKNFSKFKNIKKKNIIPYGIDINLGCPAKKVYGKGGGAALCKNPNLVKKIVEAVVNNTKLPVSIKVRIAVEEIPITKVLDQLSDLPLAHIMVHGRTLTQGFSGEISTKEIDKIREKYSQWDIWANGGINSSSDGKKVINETNCTTIGLARGTYGNPLLGAMIKKEFDPKRKLICKNIESVLTDSDEKSIRILTNLYLAYIHSVLLFLSKGNKGMLEIRKHLAWYVKDFPNASNWRKKLVRVENLKEIENILTSIIKKEC